MPYMLSCTRMFTHKHVYILLIRNITLTFLVTTRKVYVKVYKNDTYILRIFPNLACFFERRFSFKVEYYLYGMALRDATLND